MSLPSPSTTLSRCTFAMRNDPSRTPLRSTLMRGPARVTVNSSSPAVPRRFSVVPLSFADSMRRVSSASKVAAWLGVERFRPVDERMRLMDMISFTPTSDAGEGEGAMT